MYSDHNTDLDDEPLTVLNDQAWDLVHQILNTVEELRVEPVLLDCGAMVLDFGVEATGSLAAGLALAEVCLSGLADVQLLPGDLGGIGWPQLFVQTDDPVEACLLSQYAGWQLATDNYFAMASGPMRAAAGKEDLFEQLEYHETPSGVVGVLESRHLPPDEVALRIAQTCQVPVEQVALLVAPTASLAGNMQVVARSVETALHKLFELGFDVTRIESACGSAPVPPVAADDLTGIGRTNDAILYGGRVTLWVHGDDESLREIGPRIPSSASAAAGKPFLEIFEAANRDFYKIDPLLFSPAEIVLQNVQTGNVLHFGGIDHALLKKSFGLR